MREEQMRQLKYFLIVTLALPLLRAEAKEIFITANGMPAGSCQQDVRTPDWFNRPGNWGSGSGQIGPGTTVLICGAFVDSTPGDYLLRVGGSGTVGIAGAAHGPGATDVGPQQPHAGGLRAQEDRVAGADGAGFERYSGLSAQPAGDAGTGGASRQ